MQALEIPPLFEAKPCRGVEDSNGLWYPLMPTIDEQKHFRDMEIARLWQKYQNGDYKKSTEAPKPSSPSVRMISPDAIQVSKTYHAYTDEIINIDVFTKDPDRWPDVNIVGYNSDDNCFAFRGQACYYDSWFALAHLLVGADKVKTFYKSPSEITFPPEGLQPNLTPKEFASRVEIVGYAAWLKETVNNSPEATDLMNFLRNNSPLTRPTILGLDQSVGDPTSPPPLQFDEGSDCDQEQVAIPKFCTTYSPAQGHHVEDISVFTASIVPVLSNNDEGSTEVMPPIATFSQFDVPENESQNMEEQINAPTTNSMPAKLPDAGHGSHIVEDQINAMHNGSPMALDACQYEEHPSLAITDAGEERQLLMIEDHEAGQTSPATVDTPGSPWSLFGEVEGQEYGVSEESSTSSSLTDLNLNANNVILESASGESPVLNSPERALAEQRRALAEEKTLQEQLDAEMAAALALEHAREKRYSLRRRAPAAGPDNMDWTKSSKSSSSKQTMSSTKGKSASQIKKGPLKKGVGKALKRR